MISLFSCRYGSHLYGTNTPQSDVDIKHVVLPSLDDLLLNVPQANKVKKTNTAKNTRNTADDIDEEFIPLHVFARDFMIGQTYALELAWAVEGTHAGQQLHTKPGMDEVPDRWWRQATGDIKFHSFYAFCRELRERFLTSNIRALVGYAVNQASLYSFKGERLNAVNAAYDAFLAGWTDTEAGDDDIKLSTSYGKSKALIEQLLLDHPKYFKRTEYDIGGNRMMPCYMLLEKHLPMTNSLDHTLKVIKALQQKYGARAAAASEDNVDWKAMMHAVRIVNEGIKLLAERNLSFPLPEIEVERLLKIKRGEVPLEDVRAELDEKLDRLKALEASSELAKSTPQLREELDAWLLGWLKRFYALSH